MSKNNKNTIKEVECPSCSRLISESFINFHLDSCLEETSITDKTAQKRQKRDQKENLKTHVKKEAETAHTILPERKISQYAPLAEAMRPSLLEEYEGQVDVLGEGTMLRSLIESISVPSLILWGPPGCGKTTLAHIVATKCKANQKSRFVTLSATTSGVKEVKEAIEKAKNEQRMFNRKTILFIDEIHRFNKLQQDVFLPHVENGTITLIGATTENPSFSLNSALLSRCRVVVLHKLSTENVLRILKRALIKLNVKENSELKIQGKRSLEGDISDKETFIEPEALQMLADVSDGDARFALNCLDMAFQSLDDSTGSKVICKEQIKKSLQRVHTLYDRAGDQHYDTISAFIKSMRGSDANAALYYMARMLEGGEDPRFIARRMMIFASEDVGLADSTALNLAVSTSYTCQNVGLPECKINLAHCATYLALAPKSRASHEAYQRAEQAVKDCKGPLPSIPLHLRNAPTRLMKDLGYSKGYQMYNHDGAQLPFLPEPLIGTDFFKS